MVVTGIAVRRGGSGWRDNVGLCRDAFVVIDFIIGRQFEWIVLEASVTASFLFKPRLEFPVYRPLVRVTLGRFMSSPRTDTWR